MGRGREESRAHCRRSVSLKRGLTQEPLSQDGSGGDICDCVTLICERAERESRERQPIDARHACTILSGDAVTSSWCQCRDLMPGPTLDTVTRYAFLLDNQTLIRKTVQIPQEES
jgi:hypothetical protein